MRAYIANQKRGQQSIWKSNFLQQFHGGFARATHFNRQANSIERVYACFNTREHGRQHQGRQQQARIEI